MEAGRRVRGGRGVVEWVWGLDLEGSSARFDQGGLVCMSRVTRGMASGSFGWPLLGFVVFL
jgi:hypothetical protein